MKKCFYILVTILLAVSCDLTESMQVDADKAMVFGSESGLRSYAYSFYDNLPSTTSAYLIEDGQCDYCTCNAMNAFYQNGAFNVETSTGWSWTALHSINYFLDGLHSSECTVSESVKKNYEGIGRWFRAYFYFDKFAKYGGVPWYDHCIQNYETDELYKDRNSRDDIVEHMIEDLEYAYANISAKSSVGSSTLTKWVAAAFLSRVCLYEASWRKYHNEGGKYSPEDLYKIAAEYAGYVMANSGYKLNTSAGTNGAYRDLFTSEETITDEVLLAVCCNKEAGVYGAQNWKFNSASYGNHDCLARSFVHTFLMSDGTPFTNKAGYDLSSFKEEFTNRDGRLAQIVRGPSYKRDGVATAPDIVSVAHTGYHIIKFSLDEKSYDNQGINPNGTPLIRYAEVLLNYAEAKAELGTLTDAEWTSTIGALRRRAGITGGTNAKPTVLDSYMHEVFYPEVNDPVIMEIRRERAVELFFEGFRRNDLNRWACGHLFQDLPWTGIHFASLNSPVDLNGDGKNDVYFSETPVSQASSDYKNIWVTVNSKDEGLWAVANPSGGYDLVFKNVNMRVWYSDNRQYLYPIPAKIIRDYKAEGYTMTQNPNW